MPTSNWQNISYNIDLIKKINPKSILDVGVGFGRWGILFREFLELWNETDFSKSDSPDWEIKITGIEIFPAYIKPYHHFFYTEIIIKDIKDYLTEANDKFDLINFGDVIEHLTKKDALTIIEKSLNISDYVLINIPIGKNWEQSSNINPYEEHKSIWQISDFKNYPNKIIKIFNDHIYRKFAVVLLSKNEINLNKKLPPLYNLKNFMKYKLGLINLINSK
ncbi:MAG: class I SAM-dependent methyltransferase [Ignavibacteria bacterium]|nr:class I SAM-dependent methyltransferase [Ignavibacteria bacterium]